MVDALKYLQSAWLRHEDIADDEPVDVTNITEFLHAGLSKTHPLAGVQIMELAPGHPLIPFSDLHDKLHSRGASMTLDATSPPEWIRRGIEPARVSFAQSYPRDVQARILADASSFGLASD